MKGWIWAMLKIGKEQISKLNEMAQVSFEAAKLALDIVNDMFGTEYGWLNKRVVFFDDPKASTAEKYKNAHDAWVYAD